MSLREEIEKLLKDEIKLCNDYLGRTKKLASIAPDIQRRKEEAEAHLESISTLPDDLLEEIGHEIKSRQENEIDKLNRTIPLLPDIEPKVIRVNMTSTTTSSSSDNISSILRTESIEPVTVKAFYKPISRLAKDKERIRVIKNAFSNLNPDLSNFINQAQETSKSAKGGVASIELACQHLRTSIQKIWGEIAHHARNQCESLDNMRLELAKKSHRLRVAECLGETKENVEDIKVLLKSISILYSDLSGPSKDPFMDDKDFLEEVTTRWNIHLYNLSQALGLIT